MLKLKKNFKISNLTSLKKCNYILILLISIVLVLLKSSDSLNVMAEENNLEITDINKKIRELTGAANSGDVSSQFLLGKIALESNNPPDYPTAVYWFRIAAESDHLEAQELLGAQLFAGLGVPQDSSAARNWWLKAANRGSMKAQASLGVLFALGHGVEKNFIESYKWLTLAAKKGNKAAKEQRDNSIILQMSAEQIRKAQEKVEEFLEQQKITIDE